MKKTVINATATLVRTAMTVSKRDSIEAHIEVSGQVEWTNLELCFGGFSNNQFRPHISMRVYWNHNDAAEILESLNAALRASAKAYKKDGSKEGAMNVFNKTYHEELTKRIG